MKNIKDIEKEIRLNGSFTSPNFFLALMEERNINYKEIYYNFRAGNNHTSLKEWPIATDIQTILGEKTYVLEKPIKFSEKDPTFDKRTEKTSPKKRLIICLFSNTALGTNMINNIILTTGNFLKY